MNIPRAVKRSQLQERDRSLIRNMGSASTFLIGNPAVSVHLYLTVKILRSLIPQFATDDFSDGVLRQDVSEEDAARAFVAGEPGLVKVVDLLFGQGGLPEGPVAHLPGGIDTIYKYLYTSLVSDKSILWVGSSLDDVRSFKEFMKSESTRVLNIVSFTSRSSARESTCFTPFRRKHELRQRVISIWHGDD